MRFFLPKLGAEISLDLENFKNFSRGDWRRGREEDVCQRRSQLTIIKDDGRRRGTEKRRRRGGRRRRRVSVLQVAKRGACTPFVTRFVVARGGKSETQNGPSIQEVGTWIKSERGQRLGDRAISDLERGGSGRYTGHHSSSRCLAPWFR